GLAQVPVVSDHEHHAARVIFDAEYPRLGIRRRFPRPAAIATVADVGNLHDLVDIEERVKDLFGQRKRLELAVWKDLRHLPREVPKLIGSPEIIGMEKSAAQQKFTQARRFLVAEQHLAGLDDVEIGKITNLVIHELHRMRSITISLDVRQPIDAPDELAIRRRIVRAPSATHAALAALQIRTFEVAKRWIARRKRAAPCGRSDTVVQ